MQQAIPTPRSHICRPPKKTKKIIINIINYNHYNMCRYHPHIAQRQYACSPRRVQPSTYPYNTYKEISM